MCYIRKGEESHHQPPGYLSWVNSLACSWLSRVKASGEKDAPSKQLKLQTMAHSSVRRIQVRVSLPFTSSVGHLWAVHNLHSYSNNLDLGGEDLDFTTEKVQQAPRPVGENSHVKAYHDEISQLWGWTRWRDDAIASGEKQNKGNVCKIRNKKDFQHLNSNLGN